MGRAADPRVTVRLSGAEFAALDGAAVAVGVETGGLLKAAAMRGLAGAVADVEAGRLRVRRRSVSRPVVEREPGAVVAPRLPGERSAGSENRPNAGPAPSRPSVGAVDRAVAARRAAGLL